MKVAKFLSTYRNAPHCTTGVSPAILMFGRKLRTKLDMLQPNIGAKVAQNQSKQVASHSAATEKQYEVGDPVLARDYRGDQRWQQAKVTSQLGPRNFTVEVGPGQIWKRHADQLTDTTPMNEGGSTENEPTTSDQTPEREEIPPSPNPRDLSPSPNVSSAETSSPTKPKDVVTRAGRTSKKPKYLENYV